jgi:hypothetical protein
MIVITSMAGLLVMALDQAINPASKSLKVFFAASVDADRFLVPPSSVPRRARSHGNRVRNLPDRTTNHTYTPSSPSAALDLANTKRPLHGRMTASALPRFQVEDADRLSYHFNERNSAAMHDEYAVYDETDM